MSAIPLVIWLPEPIATASRACFSAGTSLTPSPIIAVKRPRVGERPDQRLLLLGRDPAEDRVALAPPRPARSGSSGSVGPSITPASRGHADRVGDRGHRRARVAGDQLQVDLLLAHELDRLGGVGAQRLLEHDQGARLEPRRRLGGGVGGQRARRASPKATTRRPARGLLLERALRARAAASARPACAEHVGRPEHVAASPSRAVERQPAPLPLRGERAPRRRPAPASPGKRSAIVSSVRLRSPALAAKRASACVGRPPARARRRPRPRPARSVAVGQGAGLVDADRVDRGERTRSRSSAGRGCSSAPGAPRRPRG